MNRGCRVTDEEIEAIIAHERQIQRAPDVVRARLLARARAGVATAQRYPAPIAASASAPARPGIRITVAATLLLTVAAGGVAAMIQWRTTDAGALVGSPPRQLERPTVRASAVEVPEETFTPRLALAERPRPLHRRLSLERSYAAELRLLRRVQSNYADQDFTAALVLIAEHARRFPNGRLVEEREALRVRSLVGAGRADAARRALAAFAERFPRSVLLRRLQEAARDAESSPSILRSTN